MPSVRATRRAGDLWVVGHIESRSARPVDTQAPWLTGFATIPPEASPPRAMSPPHPSAVGTYGEQAVKWAEAELGIVPRWWQALALHGILEHDAAGAPCWTTVVVASTPRLEHRRQAYSDRYESLKAMAVRAYDHGFAFRDDDGDELPEGWQTSTFQRLQRLEIYASQRVGLAATPRVLDGLGLGARHEVRRDRRRLLRRAGRGRAGRESAARRDQERPFDPGLIRSPDRHIEGVENEKTCSDLRSTCGRYWVRTSDLFGVNEARYHCANRPRLCGRQG